VATNRAVREVLRLHFEGGRSQPEIDRLGAIPRAVSDYLSELAAQGVSGRLRAHSANPSSRVCPLGTRSDRPQRACSALIGSGWLHRGPP
jgi:hypothetical protein